MAKKLSPKDIELLDGLKLNGNIPKHIAIIMDGNGRWALKKGLPRAAGHRKGVETVRIMVESCIKLDIKYLTLYTFSTENWKRPQKEITTLMRLMVRSLQNETNELHANGVRINTIGDKNLLPQIVLNELEQAVEKTKNNTKLVLNLAVSYSGRWEITQAVKKIAQLYKNNEITLSDIDETLISKSLDTADMPDPDLMIRSGGEYRISNFLIWQLAYSELYVSNVLWPQFKCKHLVEAIENYQSRERRFGLISEQLSNNLKQTNNVNDLSKEMV